MLSVLGETSEGLELPFCCLAKLVALKLPIDRSCMLLKITMGCCACYQHSEDRICACLERLARPWRSDGDRETPKPVLILFSPVWYLFFYWESDFTRYSNMMSQPLFSLRSQHGALSPAVPGHWCASGISAAPLCVCTSLLLPFLTLVSQGELLTHKAIDS